MEAANSHEVSISIPNLTPPLTEASSNTPAPGSSDRHRFAIFDKLKNAVVRSKRQIDTHPSAAVWTAASASVTGVMVSGFIKSMQTSLNTFYLAGAGVSASIFFAGWRVMQDPIISSYSDNTVESEPEERHGSIDIPPPYSSTPSPTNHSDLSPSTDPPPYSPQQAVSNTESNVDNPLGDTVRRSLGNL